MDEWTAVSGWGLRVGCGHPQYYGLTEDMKPSDVLTFNGIVWQSLVATRRTAVIKNRNQRVTGHPTVIEHNVL